MKPPPTVRRLNLALVLLGLLAVLGCRSAVWAPDSKTIAVDLGGKLRLFDVAGGLFRTLPTSGGYVLNPAWSPDGKQLAYYAVSKKGAAAGSIDLWVRDLGTNQERKVVSGVAPVTGIEARGKPVTKVEEVALRAKMVLCAAWSPDSRRLAYNRFSRMRLESSGIELFEVGSGKVVRLADKNQARFMPGWSPDGKQLAFLVGQPASAATAKSSGEGAFAVLCVMDADGSHVRRVLASSEQAVLWPFSSPTWSPDGRSLVALSVQDQGILGSSPNELFGKVLETDVWIVPAAGGAGRVLTKLSSPFGMVAPDLQSVVYVRLAEGVSVIHSTAPFNRSRTLDQLFGPDNQPPSGTDPKPTEVALPVPVFSPDSGTVALPTNDLAKRRYQLRLYHLRTGEQSLYPVTG